MCNVKYYHGTSSALPISDVLLPSSSTHILREGFRSTYHDTVFLTVSIKSAKMYARKACDKYGGQPVVYIARPIEIYSHRNTECLCDSAKITGRIP